MKILSVKKDVWPLRWHQLAVMLDAGLPIEKAIYALGKNSNETEINQLVASVQSGESFSLALTKIKTINDFDRELLSCAEKAGCLSKALAYLAELKITKKQNIDTLRASLILPKLVLVIGMFASILIRIASYGQGPIEAVFKVGFITVITMHIINKFIKLLSIDIKLVLSIVWPYQLLRTTHTQLKQEFEQLFYRCLLWQLSTGVDASTALGRVKLLLKPSEYRHSVERAQKQCAQGIDLPTALMNNGLILTTRMIQILNTANTTGDFEKAVGQELGLISEKLKQNALEKLKWWPRLIYVFVMVIIIRLMM